MQELIKGTKLWADLTDDDFYYYARQKIVDMKIGLDIAVLAEKRLVNQIVLVAGDSDFEWAQYLIEQGVLDREVYESARRNVGLDDETPADSTRR